MWSSWLGVLLIGFLVGLLARMFASDPRNPQGCLLTTFLGVMGAVLFTWIGQVTGMYAEGEQAGFVGAVVGAVIVLAIWRALLPKR
jgi:uncharacterized membrane protein YeaQ/YmgE (transglycosylase-associated protein family)